MRKLLGICMVVLALCAFGITSANAAGPWCISLTNYCDKIEVARDANLNLYGIWDSDCDGTFETVVQGSAINALNNLVGYTAIYGVSGQMYFNVPGRTLDYWGYTGTGTPSQYINDTPWSITPGQCPHAAAEAGLPALND